MTSTGAVRRILGRVLTPWQVAYGAETRRRLAWSVVAVPRALATLAQAARRPGRVRGVARALLALPVALTGSALTATLAFLVLINVPAYGFRPWLGLVEDTGADWYAHSWGGPTLAGAWATHAAGVLLLVLPVVAWAVRGLTALQWRLTGTTPNPPANGDAAHPAPHRSAPHVAAPVPPARAVVRPSGRAGVRPAGRGLHRVAAGLAALGLLVAFSLTAHANGIGDNLLWTPRDATSGVALAVTLAPVAGLLLLRRTAWWRATRH
ncbi:hypothetical protein Q2K19_10065 [Micromonospora soli]|uniref:hypothetical protein n=1 Tax=Micromonospora sp. NBRC 110009 TaxID=3061627 RepID=UPI0026717185|nr:hypothetical protein [Micromonospora sp. NBRC 110009]WKU00786.1 hypothetical protein Q2K19_10065 [Micromonospora sp. NBRC 110009]